MAPQTRSNLRALGGTLKESVYTLRKTTKSRIARLKPKPKADTKARDPNLLQVAVENSRKQNNKAHVRADPVSEVNPEVDPDGAPLPEPKNLNPGLFELGRELGHGKWGRVYLARHRVTGYICALKVITKGQVTKERQEKLLRRELEIHRNLAHPSILRFLGWFHDDTHIFLILEYAAGGDLFMRMRKQPDGRFSEELAAQYAAQLAGALKYMHSKNMMHRDIKPENILLGLHGELKLADFGYSIHSPSGQRSTFCGTPDYISPEIAIMQRRPGKSKAFYDHGVDLWSLGVLAYELSTGKTPFEAKNPTQTIKKIINFKGNIKVPAHVSKEGKEFIKELMNVNADERPSLDEVLQHPWIQKHCHGKDVDYSKLG